MTLPKIVTRDEWLAARVDLLAKEKELTRLRDKISTERRNLPMVEIDKPYRFDGPAGSVGLADLFDGRRQLILYHFMFHPDWEDGCPSCSAGADELSQGFFDHLHTRDTSYAMVSRAPLEKLERWKAKKGWDIPWYSSYGTDFNTDFGVTIDESVGADTFNYRSSAEYKAIGAGLFSSPQPFDMPGRSCFLRVDDRIFHTYSQYARGLECTAVRTTSSISPHSDGRTGRNRRVGASRLDRQRRISRRDAVRLIAPRGTVGPIRSSSPSGSTIRRLGRRECPCSRVANAWSRLPSSAQPLGS